MKTSITVQLDTALLRKARALAAGEGTSISTLLRVCLEQIVNGCKAYAQSRRRAIARLRKGVELRWTPSHSRDELHER
jgi:hypothetical protein